MVSKTTRRLLTEVAKFKPEFFKRPGYAHWREAVRRALGDESLPMIDEIAATHTRTKLRREDYIRERTRIRQKLADDESGSTRTR